MAWTIEIDQAADRQIRKLGRVEADRITRYLGHLTTLEDPRQKGEALVSNLKGFWRYRVGDHRVIAQFINNRLVILVLTIKHDARCIGRLIR